MTLPRFDVFEVHSLYEYIMRQRKILKDILLIASFTFFQPFYYLL